MNICPDCGMREAIEALAQSRRVAQGKAAMGGMTLQEAVNTLDGVIPTPDSKMVDLDHLAIATAWQKCKKALVSYSDMQDRHDTLMRRWEGMIETIRKKIDAGTLTIENSQLLDALNLPHGYDKRIPAAQGIQQDNAPLTVEELREMAQRCEGIYIAHTNGSPVFRDQIYCAAVLDFSPAFGSNAMHVHAIYGDKLTMWEDEYGKTWLAYRQKPGVCGK